MCSHVTSSHAVQYLLWPVSCSQTPPDTCAAITSKMSEGAEKGRNNVQSKVYTCTIYNVHVHCTLVYMYIVYDGECIYIHVHVYSGCYLHVHVHVSNIHWYSICLERRRSRVRVPPEAALLFLWKKKSCLQVSLLAFALSL